MKVVALISGGKDSLYAAHLAKKQGHEIKYLATIRSKNPHSYMYHTPNIGMTVIQSTLMGVNLVSKESTGEKEKELHDLEVLLDGLEVEGVVCGAVESKYQKTRLEKICKKFGLKLLVPLWGRDPEKLLKDMVKDKFEIIIAAVAAQGLDKKWLGRKINQKTIQDLKKLNKKYSVHITGEGGEFETFVTDCPLFSKKIKIKEAEKVWNKDSGVFLIKKIELEEKKK